MSTDDYQRVIRIAGDFMHGDALLRDDEHGPLKVVPADAFVVLRSTVPTFVEIDRPHRTMLATDGTVASPRTLNPEALRHEAGVLLAAAEYLEAHPPVDEAQVRALMVAIDDAQVDNANTLARRLVEQGWTNPEATR